MMNGWQIHSIPHIPTVIRLVYTLALVESLLPILSALRMSLAIAMEEKRSLVVA
jgi:hypothetical protein